MPLPAFVLSGAYRSLVTPHPAGYEISGARSAGRRSPGSEWPVTTFRAPAKSPIRVRKILRPASRRISCSPSPSVRANSSPRAIARPTSSPLPEHRARVTRRGVCRPCKRSKSRFSEPRPVDFRLSSSGHRDGRARHPERTAPSSRRARPSRRRRRVQLTTRVSVLTTSDTGPRDRRSGIDDRGIGRVDRHSRHHDRRCCHG